MRNFIKYYKWHMIFLLIVIICLGFMLSNTFSKQEPDLTLSYTGINYINIQNFNDRKVEIENLILKDANGDGKSLTELYTHTLDLEKDVDKSFEEIVESDSFDIYITTKSALENYKDKSKFVDVTDYLTLENGKYETLKDNSGYIYAVSLKDNKYITELGFLDTTDLYIAVAVDADTKNGEISTFKKNARNVTGYILGEN